MDEEFLKFLPEGSLKAGEKIYKIYSWLVNDISDENLTIVHFDYRVDNLFFDMEDTENPVIVFNWGAAAVSGGF